MLWLKGKTSDVEAIRQYIISLHIVWQLSECKHCGMPNRNEWTALSLSLYEETHQPIYYIINRTQGHQMRGNMTVAVTVFV